MIATAISACAASLQRDTETPRTRCAGVQRFRIGPDSSVPAKRVSRPHGRNADPIDIAPLPSFARRTRKAASIVADRQPELPVSRVDVDGNFDLCRLRVAEYVREPFLDDPQQRTLALVWELINRGVDTDADAQRRKCAKPQA